MKNHCSSHVQDFKLNFVENYKDGINTYNAAIHEMLCT